LLKDDTIVYWLPYDSIEVVFNMKNLWANRQNHHPACIMYDFEAVEGDDFVPWAPLIRNEEESTNLPFEYVTEDAKPSGPASEQVVERIRLRILNELQESMRKYRGKKGLDTLTFNKQEILDQLMRFLELQETRQTLDIDFCPLNDKDEANYDDVDRFIADQLNGLNKCNKDTAFRFGRPINYVGKQSKGWEGLKKKVKMFLKHMHYFPTKRGHKFTGFPIMFCTSDKDQIRALLFQHPKYQKYIDLDDTTLFTTQCLVTPMIAGVNSVWLYFGSQHTEVDDSVE